MHDAAASPPSEHMAAQPHGDDPAKESIPSTTAPSDDQQDQPIPSDSSVDSHVDKENHEAAVATATPPKQELKDFEQEPKGKRAIVMLALCMAVFLAALDVTIITTAVPTIVAHFKSPSGYTWIGSSFLLANAASVPTWGKVSEIFGRKPILLTANVVFLVGSLVCGLANSIGMLIAGRAVQGLGAGGLVILVNITIADLFSLRNRGAYYGIIGGVWAISSAIGPIIGGAFTQHVSWRWCFYVNLPLDGAAFIIILFFLKLNTPKTPLWDGLKAIDWLGSLLVVGGTLMFLFGLQFGGSSHPWKSAIVLCLIIFGIVTWAVFLLVEWKVAKYPVIPISIFKNRSVAACYICVFLHGAVFIATSYYLPLYFQACRGASPLISGVYLLPNCVALSIGSLGVGIFIRKTGRYIECMYLGFFFMTLGYGLLINLEADSSLAKVVVYQLIAGLGIGPLFQSPLIALQSHVKPRDIAPATATLGFIRQLSTSISVVIGGVIFQNQMTKKTGTLVSALGSQIGHELTGSGAGSNTQLVQHLPQPGRSIAENAFGQSLSKVWILYTVLAFIGLLVTPLIVVKKLSRDHTENKTGLAAEKEKAEERKLEAEERVARKKLKVQHAQKPASGTNDMDLEKGALSTPAGESGSPERNGQAAVKSEV